MYFFHPGVAKISCAKCLTCAHDFETGEPMYHVNRDGSKILYDLKLDPNYKPRCLKGGSCPRENPTKGKEYDFNELSVDIMLAYLTASATGFVGLNDEQRQDGLLMKCFAILARMEQRANRQEAAGERRNERQEEMVAMLTSLRKGATQWR